VHVCIDAHVRINLLINTNMCVHMCFLLCLQDYQKLFELDPDDFGAVAVTEKEATSKYEVSRFGDCSRFNVN
jgi:hypothetical protein